MAQRGRNRLKIAGKQTVPGRDCADMIDEGLPRSRILLLVERSQSNPPLADNTLETNMRQAAPRRIPAPLLSAPNAPPKPKVRYVLSA
jgi:hypothetical protein